MLMAHSSLMASDQPSFNQGRHSVTEMQAPKGSWGNPLYFEILHLVVTPVKGIPPKYFLGLPPDKTKQLKNNMPLKFKNILIYFFLALLIFVEFLLLKEDRSSDFLLPILIADLIFFLALGIYDANLCLNLVIMIFMFFVLYI